METYCSSLARTSHIEMIDAGTASHSSGQRGSAEYILLHGSPRTERLLGRNLQKNLQKRRHTKIWKLYKIYKYLQKSSQKNGPGHSLVQFSWFTPSYRIGRPLLFSLIIHTVFCATVLHQYPILAVSDSTV